MTVSTRALRRPARVLAVLAMTAPLVGVLVGIAPGTAFADQTTSVSLSGISDGNVISSPSDAVDVTATGTITNTGSTKSGSVLYLYAPTATGGQYEYSNTGISGCTVQPLQSSCTSKVSASFRRADIAGAPNGHWTAVVGASSKGFYTNYPPTSVPSNVAAAANGRNEVDLSWSYSGTEPDKAGFEIAETHSGSTRTLQVGTSACNGQTCGYAITGYPTPAPGTTDSYSYTVTALRQSGGCSTCGSVTRSSASSSADAQLVGPPPAPSPTPTPSGGAGGGTTGAQPTSTGGSTSPSSGGATGGSVASGATGGGGGRHGSTGSSGSAARPITVPTLPPLVQSRRAFALGFNSFSPSLGIPKLPPLPNTTFPVVEPGSGGVYQPTLPYATKAPRKTTSVLSSPIASISSSLNTHALVPLLAMSLILLAVAAHVRVFLGRTIDD